MALEQNAFAGDFRPIRKGNTLLQPHVFIMNKAMLRHPIVSLIATAVLCGLLWRIEVEYRGWAGLLWLSYFHYAIPAGFALFLLWANHCIDMKWQQRVFFNLTAAWYGAGVYLALALSLSCTFASGPAALVTLWHKQVWWSYLCASSSFLVMLFLPVGAYLILTAFRKKVRSHFLVFGIAGMLLSVPLSIVLLFLFQHKGGHDTIHAIKSGILIPFWVFSLGLLILGQRQPIATLADNTEQ